MAFNVLSLAYSSKFLDCFYIHIIWYIPDILLVYLCLKSNKLEIIFDWSLHCEQRPTRYLLWLQENYDKVIVMERIF